MMRKAISAIFVLFAVFSMVSCEKDAATVMDTEYSYTWDNSSSDPDNGRYLELLTDMTGKGVPGVMMAVNRGDGSVWLGSAGYSSLKTMAPMLPDNRTRVGSTVKTLTAVTILQLCEEGRISLDDKVSDYLPEDVLDRIENADVATVRQLLQHSSGIYNYIQDLQFQTASMNDLTKEWFPDELLSYARGRSAYFAPDEDCYYSNTGYVLLGKVIEEICGRPFYKEFEDRFFRPLGMSETAFAEEDPVPDDLVRGYVDFFSTMKLLESTWYSGWDYHTADGGLISNPYNLTVFMRALFSGRLLKPETMEKMLSWKTPLTQDPAYYEMGYGLGIFRYRTGKGDIYGHSGDAIGYYAIMLYHPESDTAISWAVNGNYGNLDAIFSSKEAMDRILETVLP